jgi:hypothetical protein
MYIRKHKNTSKRTGKTYISFAIVDSERIGDTTVQKTILTLGSNFTLPEEKWCMLVKKIQLQLYGQQTLFEDSFNKEYDILAKNLADQIIAKRIAAAEKKESLNNSDVIKVKRSEIDGELFRTVGPEHVSLYGAQRIGLLEIFDSLDIGKDKAKLALAAVMARMVHPSSERETFRWLRDNSSLSELLGIEINSEASLHRIADIIYENKSIIELKINNNINNLFKTISCVTFYDLTNSYFEGHPKCDKAKRGHCKSKRKDCLLITLAVVLDSYGFVIRSEIYSGNISEPSTLQEVLTNLQATDLGKVVMDQGIATAENVRWLQQNNYKYLVVNREQKRTFNFKNAMPLQTKGNYQVQIYKELTKDGLEARLYCYSEKRDLKESAIWARKAEKFEAELAKINDGLTKHRNKKDKEVIDRRIGRLFEKCSGISRHYTVSVEDNAATKSDKEPLLATKILWTKNTITGTTMDKPGVYCIKSNELDMSAEEMWRTYSQLTDIESVFRSLKSELGLRPIFHQKEERIESHLFLSVLAYQCVQSIRNILKSSGIIDSWWSIRECLNSHGRLTYILPDEKGGIEKIRKAMKPESCQVDIYRALRITQRPGGQITIE